MSIHKRAEDPQARVTRPQAVELIQRGLTPSVVADMIAEPYTMGSLCNRFGVDPGEVEWLAARWPVHARVRAP